MVQAKPEVAQQLINIAVPQQALETGEFRGQFGELKIRKDSVDRGIIVAEVANYDIRLQFVTTQFEQTAALPTAVTGSSGIDDPHLQVGQRISQQFFELEDK